MKKTTLNALVIANLVALLRLDPQRQRDLVARVACGLDRDISRAELSQKVKQALSLELEAALKGDRVRHLANARKLMQFLEELGTLDQCVNTDTVLPEEGQTLYLAGTLKTVARPLKLRDLPAVCGLLKTLGFWERRALLRSPVSGDLMAALFDWYANASEFPVTVVEESKEPICVTTVFRDQVRPGIGSIALGIHPDYVALGVREAMLEILMQQASGRFQILEAHVTGSQLGAMAAFRGLHFSEREFPNYLPDGMGGRESWVLFYAQLVTDEEFASAGD